MIYADTDFFLALMKESDWLQTSAKRLLQVHKDKLWTSPVTLIELLLVSAEFSIDPERLMADALELTHIQGGEVKPILITAHYIKSKGVGVFDSLHAAFVAPTARSSVPTKSLIASRLIGFRLNRHERQ